MNEITVTIQAPHLHPDSVDLVKKVMLSKFKLKADYEIISQQECYWRLTGTYSALLEAGYL